MKPVFRRPFSIIKQLSGLTVNQTKQPSPSLSDSCSNTTPQVSNQSTQRKNMKHIFLILALATLTACASSHTGGYGYAGNNGASAGVTQTFRW